MKKNKKDFLSIADLTKEEIMDILELAKKLKKELKTSGKNDAVLTGNQIAMFFEKPSLRTKLSFAVAADQLGAKAIYFGASEVGLGVREPVSDVAKVTSSIVDAVIARVFSHKTLGEFAKNSTVPVINALSDLEHPCQALADFLTIVEIKGKLEGLTLAYIGDGNNNVPHSLALGCAILGIHFRCASPKGYGLNEKVVKKAKDLGTEIAQTENAEDAVKDADIVYTDTWISMGDETEKEKRLNAFKGYQVNQELMGHAKPDAIFMHDMPAYRNNEVAAEVIDGPQSVIFQQAENRLHAQKALLVTLIK